MAKRNIWVGLVIVAVAIGAGTWFGESLRKPVAIQGLRSISEEDLEPPWSQISFKSSDRILVLAPHPDDEVLGCGGVMQKAKALNVPVKIVFLTYGDMNEWAFLLYRKHPVVRPKSVRMMGLIRHDEAIKAAKVFGMDKNDLVFLGYPDFGTLNIWKYYWNDAKPFRSILAGARAVPYKNAFRPGAVYKGGELLRDLEQVIGDFKPTKIFVSHPGDHNGDHAAFYLFTRVALWDLKRTVQAKIYPYLIHYIGWPLEKGYHPELSLEPPLTLRDSMVWRVNALSADEIALKTKALKSHHSQYMSTPGYLSSFVRHNELFGDFSEGMLKRRNHQAAVFQKNSADVVHEAADVIDQEKALLVGVEETSVAIDNDFLIVTMRFKRPLGKETGLRCFIFGYRPDRAFDMMPKIRIDVGMFMKKIYDGKKRLSLKHVKISHRRREINIRVPLSLLGEPDRVLTSAQIYFGSLPLQHVSWRIINIQDE